MGWYLISTERLWFFTDLSSVYTYCMLPMAERTIPKSVLTRAFHVT